MKVAELIEKLSKLPQNAVVVMASDPEGNDFDTMEDVWSCYYDAEDRAVMEIGDLSEEELMADRWVRAVVLWP